MTRNRTLAAALCLCLSLPMAAQARPSDRGIGDEIRQELADARKEMHADLEKARRELETENLSVGQDFDFGRHGHGRPRTADLPKAEITPQGDFLIEGEAQPIDAAQRKQLLAYRGQVVAIALDGIDAGQAAGEAAMDAVGDSWIAMMFNAMTGRLERRVERVVRQRIEPMVMGICKQLPSLMASQQALAASTPSFRPYATIDQEDVDGCEDELRREFAAR